MPAAAATPPPSCGAIISLVDLYLQGPHQRNKSHTLIALSSPESGIGDQLSNFLGALTLAIGTNRRLEILPDGLGTTSYLAAGFDLNFDASYTGKREWHEEALRWVRAELRSSLRANATLGVHEKTRTRLPRYAAYAEWGVTAAVDEPNLAARLLIPSPSGRFPPMHTETLTRGVEFVLGGNVGANVFREYFERKLNAQKPPIEYSPHAVGCVLRHLLRQPTSAVRSLVASMRPKGLPEQRAPASSNAAADLQSLALGHAAAASSTSKPRMTVGVHIRAEAHLLNRAFKSEAARFEQQLSGGRFAADKVFAGCNSDKGGGSPHRQLSNYSEYWLAALAATRRWRTRIKPAASAAEDKDDDDVRWLVVSDDAELKKQAQSTWPKLVSATSLVPTQAGACEDASSTTARSNSHREHVLHTVAELLLLAESDILILGRSRFPLAALLLSHTCTEAYHLFLDRRCRKAPRYGKSTPFAAGDLKHQYVQPWIQINKWSRKVLKCFGASRAYSARALHDEDGWLRRDEMLVNF